MSAWYMLTLVGQDQSGIVARVTRVLYELGCQLGETSMLRLGGNFTMMLMTQFDGDSVRLQTALEQVTSSMQLHLHIDAIDAQLHSHQQPNIQISVHGADRPGIIAQVTAILDKHQFNILDLESDVGGTKQQPFYIMHIEGNSSVSEQQIKSALEPLNTEGIHIRVSQIDTIVG